MIAMTFSPVYSWVLVLLVGCVLGGCILWSGRAGLKRLDRRYALGGLRFGALALLLVLLFQPQRRVDEVTVLRPQLAVLVDDSESMEDRADPRQPARAQRVREWLASPAFAAAREHFEMRTFRFDLRPSEWGGDAGGLAFKGAGSNVVAALQQARERFVGQPLAAMLVLSDGLDTSGVGGGFTLPGGLPLHTFELEKPFELPTKAKRVWISAVDPPGRIVVGWDAEVRGAVSASGMSGRTLNAELWRDGVNLVNEDDGRCVLLGGLERFAQVALGLTGQLGHDFGTVDQEEEGSGLVGNSAGNQCLTGTRWAEQKDTTWRLRGQRVHWLALSALTVLSFNSTMNLL